MKGLASRAAPSRQRGGLALAVALFSLMSIALAVLIWWPWEGLLPHMVRRLSALHYAASWLVLAAMVLVIAARAGHRFGRVPQGRPTQLARTVREAPVKGTIELLLRPSRPVVYLATVQCVVLTGLAVITPFPTLIHSIVMLETLLCGALVGLLSLLVREGAATRKSWPARATRIGAPGILSVVLLGAVLLTAIRLAAIVAPPGPRPDQNHFGLRLPALVVPTLLLAYLIGWAWHACLRRLRDPHEPLFTRTSGACLLVGLAPFLCTICANISAYTPFRLHRSSVANFSASLSVAWFVVVLFAMRSATECNEREREQRRKSARRLGWRNLDTALRLGLSATVVEVLLIAAIGVPAGGLKPLLAWGGVMVVVSFIVAGMRFAWDSKVSAKPAVSREPSMWRSHDGRSAARASTDRAWVGSVIVLATAALGALGPWDRLVHLVWDRHFYGAAQAARALCESPTEDGRWQAREAGCAVHAETPSPQTCVGRARLGPGEFPARCLRPLEFLQECELSSLAAEGLIRCDACEAERTTYLRRGCPRGLVW